VVCFSGSRDHYQLAWALAEAGLLEKLVTDIYIDPARIPFGRVMAKRRPKMAARCSPGLSHRQVLAPLLTGLNSLLMRTPLGSRSRQIWLDRSIGRRARRESWKSDTALFSYSYYAAAAFAAGATRPRFRFLFQLHPHPATVRKILQQEMQASPRFAASLQWEHELGAPPEHFASMGQEPLMANGWVVASSFTAATLVENGVPRDEIHVVPYGVDFATYPCRDCPPASHTPFRVMWIGSMTQRKGLSYLLEAVGSLPQENLEVLICGHHAVDRSVIEQSRIKSIRVLRGLPTAELASELRKADLFVLPSLAEGFGHVILEAMSSGVPVLTTAATCAPDVLTDGEHGFIVPARDSRSLAEAIQWGMAHRAQLYGMGLSAAAQARKFTWERFRVSVVKAYKEMVGRNA
jgi:glycosyltransferase involved in cell wall biosynthesis